MKPQMMLLFAAILYLLIQDFFRGGKAAYNHGSLVLEDGEILEINTTAPSVEKIGCTSCSLTASLENRSSAHGEHQVANITFNGDITFKSGSTVKVSGKNALSLTSQNGNILIETDINMTCDKKVFNTTCLGGFTQSSPPIEVGQREKRLLYKGSGPGGLRVIEASFVVITECIPGSSHGGKAPSQKDTDSLASGPEYDQQSNTSLLGGSAGSCLKSAGSVAGGGAIELVAENGRITINASINASAQGDSENSKECSGGSGGLIRLKARRVDVLANGKLSAEGGNSQWPQDTETFLFGGAGGIIQIISPKGSLVAGSLLLKHGSSNGPNCKMNDDANGYLHLSGQPNKSGHHETFPNVALRWSNSSSSTITPSLTATTAQQSSDNETDSILTTTIIEPSSSISQVQSSVSLQGTVLTAALNRLKEKVEDIITSLKGGSDVNRTAIREVLSMHKSLANQVTFTKDTQDLCVNIFYRYKLIMDFVAKRDPGFAEETLQGILDTASDCIHEKNHATWRQTRKMPKLMQILEKTFSDTVRGNSSSEINYTLTTTNAVAQVVRKRFTSSLGDVKIPDYTGIKGKDWSKESDFAVIPRQKNARSEGNYTSVILLYKNVENGLPDKSTTNNKNREDWKVSSFVMSCFFMLDGEPVKEVTPPAILNFGVSANESYERECSFWDVHHSFWSNYGVHEVKSMSSPARTVCKTDHFTSFAVLIQHKKQALSPANKLALSIITYIGCGVSTAALIITLTVLLSLESLSSDRHKIHMNLVLSLLLAQILFLAGIQETSSPTICKIIAAFLHYFFLTAFTWMLVEGLHLYLKVVQVFNIENVKILYYYIFGWGFSIIPVVITVAVRPNSYGNREICWLSTEDGTVWAFIGPVIGIIAINCFVLFMVIKTVVSSASAVKNSEHAHIKAGIKGLLVLMPILGVGWILGLFALNESTIVFEYAFAIVNGFQGLLIFLLHCAFNNEVRQAFRRQREKNALSKENDSQYHASFSLSKTEADSAKSKKLSSSNSFKASASFKKKKTTKFVQVQPVSESQDISGNSIRVKRTFQGKSPRVLAVTDIGNEISSLNCPIMEDEVRSPPKITHLKSQRTTATRKHSRH